MESLRGGGGTWLARRSTCRPTAAELRDAQRATDEAQRVVGVARDRLSFASTELDAAVAAVEAASSKRATARAIQKARAAYERLRVAQGDYRRAADKWPPARARLTELEQWVRWWRIVHA